MRLFDGGGSGAQVACTAAFVYEELTDSDAADGAFVRLDRTTVQGLVVEREQAGSDDAKLTLALHGLMPSATHTVFGSRAACLHQHNQTDLEFVRTFTTDTAGRRISIETIDIAHEGLTSIRIVRGAGVGGALVACAPGRFMDYTDDARGR